jgi:broad specificity phosphatase PhoE
MDIILVRHGETEENTLKNFSRKDIQLSQRGRIQIENTKKYVKILDFKKVYVSPLNRTVETMEILKLNGIKEERIREIDFGVFEGKNYATLEREFPKETKLWNENPITYAMPQGESIKDAYFRVEEFLQEVVERDENVLLVCHEGIIRIALSWVFDNPEYFFKFKAENGSINIITVHEGYKYINKMNYINY